MNNNDYLPFPFRDDFHITEKMLKRDLAESNNIPYDLNFEMVEENLPLQISENLRPEHIITILINENEKINSLLSILEENNKNLLKIRDFHQAENILGKLFSITELLLEAETHHQKKESYLFPELENRGVIGPIYLLRIENEEI